MNARMAASMAVALLTAVPAACTDDPFSPGGGPFSISVPFEYLLDATGRTGFRLSGVNGTIIVDGQSVDESVTVRGFRRAQDCSRAAAESLIDQLQVDVRESATEIVIQTIQPSVAGSCNMIVDYELTVPERLVGDIVNVNGMITVEDLDEGLSVTNVNGNVTLRDIEDETTVRVTNGSIDAEVTIGGDEEIDLLTVNGAVDLRVPATTSALLSIALANGTIRVLDLAVTNQIVTPLSLTGTLGAGEGAILLRTTNGDITLRGF